MNEKEAREIVVSKLEEGKKVGIISPYDTDYYGAKRYLEAIEKTQGLVEALRYYESMDNGFEKENKANIVIPKAHNALAKWGRDK